MAGKDCLFLAAVTLAPPSDHEAATLAYRDRLVIKCDETAKSSVTEIGNCWHETLRYSVANMWCHDCCFASGVIV